MKESLSQRQFNLTKLKNFRKLFQLSGGGLLQAILLGNAKAKELTITPMNDHQENLRDEAAKAFNESLKKLEELWEETADNPPEVVLEELAAAAADIEQFFGEGTEPGIPEDTSDTPVNSD